MADDFIRRKSLIENLNHFAPEHYTALVNTLIVNEPAADVVEVVRCKNCVNYHDGTGWCDEHSCFVTSGGEFCTPAESSQWKMFDPEDFCSRGKAAEA